MLDKKLSQLYEYLQSSFETIYYICRMATKDISPAQYAKWKGCHISYIHRLLLNGEIDKLDFVKSIKKYSRFYTLVVPKDFPA